MKTKDLILTKYMIKKIANTFVDKAILDEDLNEMCNRIYKKQFKKIDKKLFKTSLILGRQIIK